MDLANQDPTVGDGGGGIDRCIKHYCNKAVESLKAGRFKEAYLYANESLALDEKDAKATVLYPYALYTLHPKKRLLDKAKTLHEEADRCTKARDSDKAIELISLAKKWHCTPGVLYTRATVNYPRNRFDLAYVDFAEGLAQCKEDKICFTTGQLSSLSHLGYKVLPVIEPDPTRRLNEMPARYHVSNWPDGLRINHLMADFSKGHAVAMKIDGTLLKPHIPLEQLAQFLNHHVHGAMQSFSFMDRPHSMLPRLLDEVTVPGRLHVDLLSFSDFFLLSWANIKRILDGRTLRANAVDFLRLRLPSGVDANELLQLPALRECTHLRFSLFSRFHPQHPDLTPLFNNASLLEWVKRSDGRSLKLTREYLSSGLLGFLDDLKKVVQPYKWPYGPTLCPNSLGASFQDFRQATQLLSYEVAIHCPHMDVVSGLGVQYEELFNRLGEKMMIDVGEDTGATVTMGHQFETVLVRRLPPS